MQVKNPKFEISAVSPKQYPSNGLPEIVLVGKSNVGKSSFINTMINRKKLARTSSEPGKTRQINFYNIDEQFYFVDLPGYGYSKMSKQEQVKVNGFIDEYLHVRKNISLIVLLIDIRHKPGANDRLMYDYIIRSELPFIVIANKADKIAVTKVDDAVNEIQKDLNPIGDFTFLPFSSERKIYAQKVWDVLSDYIS
ncbi:MAG: ribosome biogenesis GTP-binding protein YihA/YsxC [Clostridia bacterium]|jgi:GTP-binding protein|nr:probable GTP-binding protein EngB [Clostridium sp. CAG:571]HJJ06317.1 ribosome biogenesis GTP-binding protein YihA/YsxC [Clostridiaceae bacterium]